MSDPAAPPHIPSQEAKSPGNFQSMAIRAGIALGIALAVFLVGWFVGKGPVGSLRDRAEQAETSLALMQDHQYMTEAALLLYRTALDLDARNFGTANDRLDEAAAVLDRVGVAGTEMESLQSSVTSMDLSVAEDLAGQRQAVLGFAESLQEVMRAMGDAASDVPAEADSAGRG